MPEYFPKIFGPSENEPLDKEASLLQFRQLQAEINEYLVASGKAALSTAEVAMGFIRVANEAMCRPIRALTQARGLDTSAHVLSCFGGAGGQHACAIARDLGMNQVLVHKYAGILSAYGMALADVVHETQEPSGLEFTAENYDQLAERLDGLTAECVASLKGQGFAEDRIEMEPFLHLRYHGTDCALMTAPLPRGGSGGTAADSGDRLTAKYGDFKAAFLRRYETEFGFVLADRRIIVDDIRVRGSGKTSAPEEPTIEAVCGPEEARPEPVKHTPVYFEAGELNAPVYLCSRLKSGHRIAGPALLIDNLSTILLEPHSVAHVTRTGDLVVDVETGRDLAIGTSLDAVQLSIFSHRFMSIAEQMGRVLQRTAISTNIKERLDFSCALFGPDGGLVSNAPHIPVHLGAMQETVQYQLRVRGHSMKNGDVFLSNHPQAGGSHLPDLTVITPVFYADLPQPVFFVASRGHHADIGGITPGSMPPHSKVRTNREIVYEFLIFI